MLPGPRVAYNPYNNLSKVLKRSDMILKLLKKRGILSEGEYRIALAEQPNISGMQKKVDESIQKEEIFANMSGAIILAPEAAETGESPGMENVENPPQSPSVESGSTESTERTGGNPQPEEQ